MDFLVVALAILAFLFTFLLTPPIGKKLQEMGFEGRDLHKEDKRKVPEQGGISVLLAFLLASFIYYFITRDPNIALTSLIVLMVGFIGIYDRIKRLSAKKKVVSLLAIGFFVIPMADTRLMGMDQGLLYLIAVPILFMALCNFTNMLAGLNGLEIGSGVIVSFGIALLALIHGQEASFAITLFMASSLLAFLYYNRYPARVFPGDVGTLIIGAAILPAVILGNFELSALIVLFPYLIDATLKYSSAGIMVKESQKATEVKNGKLEMPAGSNMSLARVFIKGGKLNEKQVVLRVWGVMLLFTLMGIMAGLYLRVYP